MNACSLLCIHACIQYSFIRNIVHAFLVPIEETNVVETADILLLPGTETVINWSPDSIIPLNLQEALAMTNNYSVDISLYQLNLASESYTFMQNLATDVPNTGTYEITIPSIDQSENFTAGVIGISVSEQFSFSERFSTRSTSNAFAQLAFGLLRRATKFGLAYVATSLAARGICSAWCSSESSNIGNTLLDRLPPCPPVRSAALNDPDFTEENFFLSFFHPGASSCFRQVVFTRYI